MRNIVSAVQLCITLAKHFSICLALVVACGFYQPKQSCSARIIEDGVGKNLKRRPNSIFSHLISRQDDKVLNKVLGQPVPSYLQQQGSLSSEGSLSYGIYCVSVLWWLGTRFKEIIGYYISESNILGGFTHSFILHRNKALSIGGSQPLTCRGVFSGYPTFTCIRRRGGHQKKQHWHLK